MSDVSLTAGMRTNLLQLQQTSKLMDMTQNRIATGNKVSSALDGPSAFFAAKALTDRASDLAGLKDGMGQAISTIKAADQGITAITSLVQQAKGLTASALQNMGDDANAVATRAALAESFNALMGQIDTTASDSTYAGKNLLQGGDKVEMSTAARAEAADALNLRGVSVTGATATDTFTATVRSGDLMDADAGSVSSTQANLGVSNLSISGMAVVDAENVRIAVVDNSVDYAANAALGANQYDRTQDADVPTRHVHEMTIVNGTDQQEQQIRLNVGDLTVEFRSQANVANTFEYRVSTDAGASFGDWTANGTAQTAAEWGAQIRDTLENEVDSALLTDLGYEVGGALGVVEITGRHDGSATAISSEVIIAGAGGMTANVVQDTANVEAEGQIVEMNLDLGGTIREGSRYVVEVNGQEFSHVVQEGATAASDVLAGLVGQINNQYTGGEIVAGTNGNNLTLTGMAAVIDPTDGTTDAGHVTIAVGGRTESVQLTISAIDDTATNINGSTVVHTNATSSLESIQIGTNDAYVSLDVNNFTTLQGAGGSSVDTAVTATAGQEITVANAAGDSVTRTTLGTTAANTLAEGSNSFSFGTSGTVRLNADDLSALVTNVGDGGVDFSTETLADTANDLNVRFNETGSSSVTVRAANVSSTGLGIEAATGEWGTLEDIEAAVAQLDQALVTLRQVSTELASNLSVVNTREDFTNNFINTLQEGADKLVLADSNEEGANMLMLQTRQQLGTISLSMASQSAQSILRLF